MLLKAIHYINYLLLGKSIAIKNVIFQILCYESGSSISMENALRRVSEALIYNKSKFVQVSITETS